MSNNAYTIPAGLVEELHKALEACGYEENCDVALWAFMDRRGDEEVTVKVMTDFQDAFEGLFSSPGEWAEFRYSDLYRSQLDDMPELQGHIDWESVAADVLQGPEFQSIWLGEQYAIFDGWILGPAR